MGVSIVSATSSSLLALAVAVAVLCSTASTTDLGFQCIYGLMDTTTTQDGTTLEYCHTQMQPPLMNKGDYLVAYRGGTCYECMCATDIGLACCECQRPRRG